MSDEYLAVPIGRDEFIRDFPDAVASPVGALGFAAFGTRSVRLAEALGQPDFRDVQLYIVLVRDTDLYLAMATLADGATDGYPPDHIRLRVTDWGQVDPEAVRERVREQPGPFYEGVILPPGCRGSKP